MTTNETDAQVDPQKEASTTSALKEEDASSSSSQEMEGATPSNILDRSIESEQEDLIGLGEILDGMTEYLNTAKMPFTMAVQGEWGIGKTSFLNLLKTRLCNNNDSLYYPVWIDACDFTLLQSSTSAVINMLQSMIYQIGNLNPTIAASQEGKKKLEAIISFIKKFGKIVVKNTIQAATEDAGSGEMAKEACSTILEYCSNNEEKQNQDSTFLTVQDLRNKVIELIDYVLDPNNNPNYLTTEATLQQVNTPHNTPTVDKNKNESDNNNPLSNNTITDQAKRGIVFFIDNLDRIDPTLSVEILEITKNIFDFSDSIFIVALDNNIALRGLREKLGDLTAESEPTFRAYFDKFVQQTITLPTQATAIPNLMIRSLEELKFFTSADNNNLFALKYDLILFAIHIVNCNPRFIKKLTNTLSLLLHIKNAQDRRLSETNQSNIITPIDPIFKALLFVIVCTQISYPYIYEQIVDKRIFTPWNNCSSPNPAKVIYQAEPVLKNWSRILADLEKTNPKFGQQGKLMKGILETIKKKEENEILFEKKFIESMKLAIYCFNKHIFDNNK